MKFILTDTFNDREISTHRTLEAAVKAERTHLRRVKKANGPNSSLTYKITASDGTWIDPDQVDHIKHELGFK